MFQLVMPIMGAKNGPIQSVSENFGPMDQMWPAGHGLDNTGLNEKVSLG